MTWILMHILAYSFGYYYFSNGVHVTRYIIVQKENFSQLPKTIFFNGFTQSGNEISSKIKPWLPQTIDNMTFFADG